MNLKTDKHPVHAGYDFAELSRGDRYKLLIGMVIPRPIALVTTVSASGQANAAPFSFFNAVAQEPPTVMLSVEVRPDESPKDTARNIRDTGEFTVHMVDDALAEKMNICAVPFDPEIDEMVEAELVTVPGRKVASPLIVDAPAALECRLSQTVSLSPTREVVFGEVVLAHVREGLVDDRFRVDQKKIDIIGRLGGRGYTRTRDQFEMIRMSPEEWAGAKADKSP